MNTVYKFSITVRWIVGFIARLKFEMPLSELQDGFIVILERSKLKSNLSYMLPLYKVHLFIRTPVYKGHL